MTGGFGDDAAFLASLGFQVQTFERHPLVYTFLKETESWAQRQGYALEAHFGSAQEQMNEILAKPSLILIDPMFEETGSAKPAKPMQWLRKLALPWSELEWERNLSWARTQAQHAVLVKSPKGQRTLPEARRFAAQSFNWELLEPF
jgi:16S rRNA (guanine1516-N2)-methyltransferase